VKGKAIDHSLAFGMADLKKPPSSTGEGGGVLNMVVVYNDCLVELGYN